MSRDHVKGGGLVIGSETGSGKTLAYLLPVFNELYSNGRSESKYKTTTFIVTPNKELSQQVLGVAAVLSGTYDSVKWGGSATTEETVNNILQSTTNPPATPPSFTPTLAVLPGGLSSPADFKPWRDAASTPPENFSDPPVHADIVICTPTTLAPLARDISNFDLFLGAQNLIVDECDMVLDGGYFKALQDILMGFKRKEKLDKGWEVKPTNHVFVGATIPDYGLRSVDAFIKRKFPNATKIHGSNVHSARHGGLTDVEWEEVDGDSDRFKSFLARVERGGLGRCMVFVNTVEAVENTAIALRSKGVEALPYHAKSSVQERVDNLNAFRSSNDKLLICTDLASRGLDIPDVETVVQLQMAGNVVAHLHRMGRCGRGGKKGVGVVYYGSQERELVEVIRDAENEQGSKLRVEKDMDEEEDNDDKVQNGKGKIDSAFSRKRGFRKKRKKKVQEME